MLDPESFDSADALNVAIAATTQRQIRENLDQWCIFRSFWGEPAESPPSSAAAEEARDRGMKIGIVTQSYYPRFGGVTEHVHATAMELVRRGHDVRVITAPLQGTSATPVCESSASAATC